MIMPITNDNFILRGEHFTVNTYGPYEPVALV